MKFRTAIISSVVACLLSLQAYACGDSLYRVGKGIAYRVYSAPLPGNLLVYGDSEGANALAEELAKSGHGVHVVGSAEELTSELGKGGYDVVIAPYSERDTVESADAPSFLPVALNRDEEIVAKQSYDRVMVPEKHEIKHYLKAIHRALKETG